MQRYGFDGIDVDWEYPVEGGLTSSNNAADKENYTLLLRAIRNALDAIGGQVTERPLLTIASSPNPAYLDNMEVDALDGILDWVNVMTYDYNGAWQSTTAHNAPLYENRATGNPFPSYSIHNTVTAYLAAGLRPSKLVVGMPTYGRGWSSIPSGSSSGLFASCSGSCPSRGTWEAGVLDYKDIKVNYIGQAGYTRYWDAASQVPYLYNGDVFVSSTTTRSPSA
jgi:chitinase